jgi:glucose/arabinose dehydrogenase
LYISNGMALRSALVAALATFATAEQSSTPGILRRDDPSCPNTLAVSYPAPVAAKGWTYRLAAKGFKKPRSILFDDNGGLLVVDSGVGVYRMTIEQDKGETCVVMSAPKMLINSTEVSLRLEHQKQICNRTTNKGTQS